MNKKLIASLLTLGLVLSPVSGAVSESYATEVSTEKSDVDLEKVELLKAYLKNFDQIKMNDLYRLASSAKRDDLDKVMAGAKSYAENNKFTKEKLDLHIKSIEDANRELSRDAKNNLNSLKANVITDEKLLYNNTDKEGNPNYQAVAEKIKEAKAILKDENLAKASGEYLKRISDDLVKLFQIAREDFDDENTYSPPVGDEYSKLDKEINNREDVVVIKKSFADLISDAEKLNKTHSDFINSFQYQHANEEERKAYDEAYDALTKLPALEDNEENYQKLSDVLKNIARARYKIDGIDLELSTIKAGSNLGDEKEIGKIISSFIDAKRNKESILKNLKDDKLKDEFIKTIAETDVSIMNFVNGFVKNADDYKKLEEKLNKLVDEINKSKGETKEEEKAVPKEESKKFDKLKSSIEKGNKFFYSDAYDKADKDKRDKFLKALVEAEALKKKYDENPALVKDEEIEKATKALDEALAGFDKFSDKDKARDAIKGLLGLTKGIKIEQIYDTKDTKEAKEAYTKAREKAAKLADDKKASLEDLDKAYKDFNESVVKLAEFLTSRLQKLVDDDKTFRDSDKYKDAEKDSKKEEAIKNYKKLVEDSEKELKKTGPDANILNVLYKKLADARAEIKDEMTSQARKLSYAIYDSYLFLETEDYKKAAVSSNENIKDAAKNYKELVEAAKALKEAGKLDSQEAKDLLDSINNAKDFMDGKISKEKYLSNKYYYILKAVREYKNGEEYKKLPQALRQKLDDALKLYETSSDEKAVFSALDAVWQEKEIQEIIKKIEWEKNPNKTRDKLLEDLNNLIAEDKKLKEGSFKYKKAQKALRDAYDLALSEAKDFINKNDKPTEEQVRAVYNKLLNTKNALDGDKFDKLIHDLAGRFKKDQMKIANPADRKAIADKINGLSGENMTMDDALRVEKELNDLINPKFAATQTLVPQSQVPTTSRPISTVTNPGSIVKTGINGIAKVAVVLVAALGIFILTSKKGDKNENN
ncbi:hypothetical protein ABLW17_07385 [Anaerococcus murdochii]|uniref:hypothetical protein n=1 Tax=Anaerococcus murdochii TaxID=411577 RepID=UPI0032B4AAA7